MKYALHWVKIMIFRRCFPLNHIEAIACPQFHRTRHLIEGDLYVTPGELSDFWRGCLYMFIRRDGTTWFIII